jgi:hypothetical protein
MTMYSDQTYHYAIEIIHCVAYVQWIDRQLVSEGK